jgi:hypothetical protein
MDIQIKCRYRSSPRSIDPEFDACTECIVSLSDTGDVTSNRNKNRNKGPALQIAKIRRQRSFNIPPVVPKERSLSATRRRDRSRSVGRRIGEFSVVNALGMENDTNNNGKTPGDSYSRKGSGQSTATVGTISAVGLEMDEEEEEGEWVEKEKGATSPPRSLVGGTVKTVSFCVYCWVDLYFGCVRVCGVHDFSLVNELFV